MERRDPLTRIALVTAVLSATGGILGAICAVCALILIATLEAGARTVGAGWPAGLLPTAAGFGGIFGMIAAPLFTWGLLRHVALGRAAVWTALGTLVGSLAGELTVPIFRYPTFLPGVIAGAFVGFVAACVLLHVRARRQAAHAAEQAV